MKRTVLIYLIIWLIAPIAIKAEKKPFGYDELYWELSDNGILTISGKGKIPDYSYGYSPWANVKINKLIIEEGITSIGNCAFCRGDFNTAIIPQSIEHIGKDAFNQCPNLTHIDIPNSVKTIGRGAFLGCDKLKSVTLSNSIKCLEIDVFAACSNLTSIIIPNSVVKICDGAFLRCNIKNIVIPNSVEYIGRSAFKSNNPTSLSLSNRLTYIGENAFMQDKVEHELYMNNEKLYNGMILLMPDSLLQLQAVEWEKCGLSESSVKQYIGSVRNKNGEVILPLKNGMNIEKCNYSANNVDFYVIKENGKCGLMNSNGSWVIPQSQDYSEIFLTEGYIKVKSQNHYGILSLDGKEIIPTSRGYTSIGDYNRSKGIFAFTKKGFIGVCDAQGREISTTRLAPTADEIKTNGGYASAVEMKNGVKIFYKVSKGGHYGLTDSEGKEIVPCEMEALESAGTGYLRYKLNGFWGVMNYTGKVIIDTNRGYTSIGDFKTFNKRFAYTMTGYKGECNHLGQQVSKIKVAIPKPSTSVASSSSSSSSSNSSSSSTASSSSGSNNNESGGGTTTIVVERPYTPQPFQEWQQCANCWGEGKVMCLGSCGGTGTYYVGDRLHICSSCGGTGKKICPNCSGQGGMYITVYR